MIQITRLTFLVAISLFVGRSFALWNERPVTCKVRHTQGGDDYDNIVRAFTACKENARVVFESGVVYNLGKPLNVTGLYNVKIILDGSISLPNNTLYQNQTTAFIAISGTDVDILAPKNDPLNGRIIGNGQLWWDEGITKGRYETLQLSIKGGYIDNLKIEQSPFYNLVLWESSYLSIHNLQITSVSDDANLPKNTDGVDLYYSRFISITDSNINNGDDCISVKSNNSDLYFANINCIGSHGVSIGSLGSVPGVYEYALRIKSVNISCTNCQNGARIKTWPAGVGLVQDITYDTFTVTGADHPIFIDQYYCDSQVGCHTGKSLVQIERVQFKNFNGTSSGAKGNNPVYLGCSTDAPCQSVYLANINITSPKANATNICTNVNDTQPIGISCISGPLPSS